MVEYGRVAECATVLGRCLLSARPTSCHIQYYSTRGRVDRNEQIKSVVRSRGMFMYRFILATVISIFSLLISILTDMLFSPLPIILRFIFQIPILVIAIEEFRRILLENIQFMKGSLTEREINSCFFFAAPMAAFGSVTLFRELRRLLH